MSIDNSLEQDIAEIKTMLAALIEQKKVRDFYSIEHVAKILGKAEFTVREWARLGRIRADKALSGRGKFLSWRIPHSEMLRLEKEGLLPIKR